MQLEYASLYIFLLLIPKGIYFQKKKKLLGIWVVLGWNVFQYNGLDAEDWYARTQLGLRFSLID